MLFSEILINNQEQAEHRMTHLVCPDSAEVPWSLLRKASIWLEYRVVSAAENSVGGRAGPQASVSSKIIGESSDSLLNKWGSSASILTWLHFQASLHKQIP